MLSLALAAAVCVATDGDSLRCGAERVRLANIDAPEMPTSPACRGYRAQTHWCDNPRLAYRSRDALRWFLRQGPVTLRCEGRDHYGRLLCRVSVNGADAGAWLVSRGYARRWR